MRTQCLYGFRNGLAMFYYNHSFMSTCTLTLYTMDPRWQFDLEFYKEIVEDPYYFPGRLLDYFQRNLFMKCFG